MLEIRRFSERVFNAKDYKDFVEIVAFIKTIYKDEIIEELEISIFNKERTLDKKVKFEKDKIKDYAVYNINVNG